MPDTIASSEGQGESNLANGHTPGQQSAASYGIPTETQVISDVGPDSSYKKRLDKTLQIWGLDPKKYRARKLLRSTLNTENSGNKASQIRLLTKLVMDVSCCVIEGMVTSDQEGIGETDDVLYNTLGGAVARRFQKTFLDSFEEL